jgi:hypothetical protein
MAVTSSTTTGPPGSSGRGPRASWWARLKPRLGRKWWAGIGAIATILGLAVALAAIFIGSGNSPSYSNKGNCNAQGSGNTVNCSVTGTRTGAGTSP